MSDTVPLFTSSAGIEHRMVKVDGGGTAFAARGETDPVIENNKILANHNDGYTKDRTLRRVASIPPIIYLKILNEEGIDIYRPEGAERLCRLLNDPDFAFLRTAPGRVSYANGRFT
jgi:hypothetical protein